jgi:hypothetical protein
VIDGPLTGAWALVEPLIRRQLPDNAELWGVRNMHIRASALGGDAALIGAAILPLNMTFSQTGAIGPRGARVPA